MYKIIKKTYVKSEFKSFLLKFTADDQSDNMFLLKIYSIGKSLELSVSAPPPTTTPHVLNHKIVHIKSEFKAVVMKLTANDQSSKSLICCLKLTPGPSDYLPLPRNCPGAIYMYKSLNIYVKSEFKSVLLK